MKITVTQLRKVIWEILKQEAERTDPLIQLITESRHLMGMSTAEIVDKIVEILHAHAYADDSDDYRDNNRYILTNSAFNEAAIDIVEFLVDKDTIKEVDTDMASTMSSMTSQSDATADTSTSDKPIKKEDPAVVSLQKKIEDLNAKLRQPLEQKAKLDKKIATLNTMKLKYQRDLDDKQGGIGGISTSDKK